MRIVFMGTPDFGVPSLRGLASSPHQIVGVVTGPDRPRGRGRQRVPTAIKQAAMALGLRPILQPEKLRQAAFLDALRALAPELIVVVAFRILPPPLLHLARYGCINLHASLLPNYRGAAPINWALINGETQTGVTTFLLNEDVDTGAILLQKEIPIYPQENAGELHDRMAQEGAELLLVTVNRLEAGDLKPRPQRGEATRAPKLNKEDRWIDWNQSARVIHNRIRGLTPVPGAFTKRQDKILKILRAQPLAEEPARQDGPRPAGSVVHVGRDGPIVVATGQGYLALVVVQPPGKRAMTAGEYVRGYKIQLGERLG